MCFPCLLITHAKLNRIEKEAEGGMKMTKQRIWNKGRDRESKRMKDKHDGRPIKSKSQHRCK